MLEPCNSLWIGDSLGAVERACLRSVLRAGHEMRLYCYSRPGGIPEGVEVRDAAELIPPERIIRHRTGSPALFANWFRYELQRRELGIWLDCDIYLLAPLEGFGAHIFGWESPDRINQAVLRLPPDCPVLPPLIALFEERSVPRWLPWRDRLRAAGRLLSTGRTGLAAMPWGSAGPNAFTHHAKRTGLDRLAAPPGRFYPVPWERAGWIADPAQPLEAAVGRETVAVHLWNECIKHLKDAPAPAGSFLARLQHEGR